MKCNYTDTKNISITIGPREIENIEILKKHVGRENRSYAICEAINRYAEQVKMIDELPFNINDFRITD